MQHITADTAGEGWFKAAQAVCANGHLIKDGDAALKESLHIFLTVHHPLGADPFLDAYADPTMIEWMRNNFLQLEPVANWGYSYGQRFFAYDGIDQVAEVARKLRANPDSKSATITLMNPAGDRAHTPCIVALDFKIRNGALITTAFFRSQDVGKKIYADVICLGEIAQRIAHDVGVPAGALHLFIASLHAYETDWEKIERMMGYERTKELKNERTEEQKNHEYTVSISGISGV